MDIPITADEPVRITLNGEPVAEIHWQGAQGHRINLIWPDGEITNIRNFQGGTAADPDLDISAGGDGSPGQPRGHVGMQWDNGDNLIVGNGRKKISLMTTGHDDRSRDRVESHVKLRMFHGAEVPSGFNADGSVKGWQPLHLSRLL